MPVTAGALVTSVVINGSVGLLCFCVFALLRQWSLTAKLYKPKRFVGAENAAGRRPRPLAAELPAGLLAWVGPVWRYPEADVINLAGLDVAVYFRLMQLGVRLFLFVSAWCLLVVMPVNYMGGYLQRHHRRRPNGLDLPGSSNSSSYESNAGSLAGAGSFPPRSNNVSDLIATDLDLLTLSNVPPGSRTMWVHLASVYVITAVTLKLLWDLSRDVAFKRAVFLAVQGAGGPGGSVLVSDLPGLEWGTPLQRLQLAWLKWLLPAGLFRRGFDQQALSAAASRRASRQQLAPAGQQGGGSDSGSQRGAAAAAAAAEQLLRQPLLQGAAAGGCEVDDGNGNEQQEQVGPPVVKDVWAEAVDVLQHNGGDVQAMVAGEMRRVYGPDSVAAVALVHDTTALDAAASQLNALVTQLEDVLDWYNARLPPPALQQGQQQVQSAGTGADAAESAAAQDVEAPGQQQQQQQQPEDGRDLAAAKAGRQGRVKRKMVMVLGPRYGSWGVERYGVAPTQVDALEFYPAVLRQQLAELQALQQAALTKLPRPAAVVTFRDQLTATLAAASLHSCDETAWSISPAPAPVELVWSALGLRTWELGLRQLAVWGAFWCLVLFYAPVVALVQAPVNMDNLKKVPFLASLLQLPLVAPVVQGFLPSLVLLIFLAALPALLLLLIRRGGCQHSTTAVDAQLIQLYFLFQLFAVFIFSFISGTALSQAAAIIDDPHRLVTLLGVSAPQQASFFSTYILLLGLSRAPLELLRLPQLGWYLLRLQAAETPRQRRRLWAQQASLLGYTLPLHSLVLLLGLVFCTASPLIAPVSLLYFAASGVCQRYQWLYVYSHGYEGAGTLWRQVFWQVLVGVYFFIAVMGCLLGIKRFAGATLLLPLAAGVLVFHVLAGRLLERPLTLQSSREAAAMDADTHRLQQAACEDAAAAGGEPGAGGAGAGGSEAAAAAAAAKAAGRLAGLPDQAGGAPRALTQEELQQLYLSPAMKLGPAALAPLLEEAEELLARLRAAGC